MTRLLCGLVTLALLGSSAGCGGGDTDRKPGFPGGDRLPLTHEFRGDDFLYVQADSGEWFQTSFGGWGSHLNPHTGHAEGDPKVGWEVIIAPPDELIEMVGDFRNTGNGDGVCDPGEACGVTAETAKAHNVWFKNPYEELELISLFVRAQSEGYIEESLHWGFDALIPGRSAGISLGHMGALSPELMELLEERVGPQIREDPLAVGSLEFNEDPIRIPAGMRLGRAQRQHLGFVEVEGQPVYAARAAVEWFNQSSGEGSDCMFLHYSEDDRVELQEALDAALQTPQPGGKFDFDFDGEIAIYAGAQGRICNSVHMNGTPYDTLSSENSRAWTNLDETREVLAIVPVHKDTGGYRAISDRLSPRGGDYLFRWAIFTDETVQQDLGISFPLQSYQGQILDLEDAEAPAGSFIMTLESGGPFLEGIQFLAIGVSYRMEADHLILRFGDAVTTVEEVTTPEPVEPGATCDGDRVRCYSRDWLGLNYPDQG